MASINLGTPIPGPKSRLLMARKERAVADAFQIHVPVAIQKASGAVITDVDGNTLIDLAGGLGCMNVGYSNPAVVAAIQAATADFSHTDFSVVMYESYIALAEELCRRTPGAFAKKAALFNAGAEAVENAVKLARKYTGRKAIITFTGAFHGRTNLAMALTSKAYPYKSGFGPFAPEIYRVPFPYVYRWGAGHLSDAEVQAAAVAALEQAFITQVSPADCAAVIIEPIQGEGGFVVPPKGYLLAVQQICRRHGLLFIVDEIQTGFGRTGYFCVSEYFGIEPDVVLLGKSLAAGLPLSAVVGRADVMDAAEASTIGGTYVGNPVAAAAAMAVLAEYDRLDLARRAQQMGQTVRVRMEALMERCALVGEVRGVGAMIGVELVTDRATRAPAVTATAAILRHCINRGVIVVGSGIYSNVLRFLMPLVITDEELSEALDVVEDAVVSVAAE